MKSGQVSRCNNVVIIIIFYFYNLTFENTLLDTYALQKLTQNLLIVSGLFFSETLIVSGFFLIFVEVLILDMKTYMQTTRNLTFVTYMYVSMCHSKYSRRYGPKEKRPTQVVDKCYNPSTILLLLFLRTTPFYIFQYFEKEK